MLLSIKAHWAIFASCSLKILALDPQVNGDVHSFLNSSLEALITPGLTMVLPCAPHGYPTLLTTNDDPAIKVCIHDVHDADGGATNEIVIFAALKITQALKPSFLPKMGDTWSLANHGQIVLCAGNDTHMTKHVIYMQIL